MAELAIPDPSVVLLVGAAGAGKSSFAARHFPRVAILSSDAMREAISGDPADQTATRAAFAALHRSLEQRLAEGQLAVIDATNVTRAARRAIRQAASRRGVPVVAIVLDLPADLVRARNASRVGRQVPDAVTLRHLGQLAATLDHRELDAEGYAQVVHLRDPDEVDRLTVRLVPSPSPGRQAPPSSPVRPARADAPARLRSRGARRIG